MPNKLDKLRLVEYNDKDLINIDQLRTKHMEGEKDLTIKTICKETLA